MRSIFRQCAFAALLPASFAQADVFHFSNIIPGDRAIGLGGAYVGVSDDASGVVFNPAGMAFAENGDVSGSANAYYWKRTVYKNIIDGLDFAEKSEGFVPTFFGAIQKLDSIAPGLVLGFAVYSPDSEVRDQNDFIASQNVRAFHRNVKLSSTTLRADLAAAKRVSGRMAIGASIGFLNLNELTQEYQFSALPRSLSTTPYVVDSSGRIFAIDSTKVNEELGNLSYIQSINGNYKLFARGLQTGLGTQFVLSRSVVLGLSAKTTFLAAQRWAFEGDRISYYRFANGQALTRDFLTNACPTQVTAANASCSDPALFDEVASRSAQPLPGGVEHRLSNEEPLGGWPIAVRGGFAWFANARFLWTLDVEHNTAVEDGNMVSFRRSAVTNFASGVEYYITPALPLRLGAFTNFDARPHLQAGKLNSQGERIDYYGATASFSWAQPSSQVGLGSMYQTGRGKANKLGTSAQQDIESTSLSFQFSARHMF